MIFPIQFNRRQIAKALGVPNAYHHATKQGVVDAWIKRKVGKKVSEVEKERWEGYAILILENYH